MRGGEVEAGALVGLAVAVELLLLLAGRHVAPVFFAPQ